MKLVILSKRTKIFVGTRHQDDASKAQRKFKGGGGNPSGRQLSE